MFFHAGAITLRTMKQSLLCFLLVITLLYPAWATVAPGRALIPRPSSVATVGPGTVISVRVLNVPFSVRYYVITYGIDRGKVIEVWHHGKLLVAPGMHGVMTYSTNPEMILDFRVIQR